MRNETSHHQPDGAETMTTTKMTFSEAIKLARGIAAGTMDPDEFAAYPEGMMWNGDISSDDQAALLGLGLAEVSDSSPGRGDGGYIELTDYAWDLLAAIDGK